MSRRHKNDVADNFISQKADSQTEDCQEKETSKLTHFNISVAVCNSSQTIINAFDKLLNNLSKGAIPLGEIEIDEKWLKIPKKYCALGVPLEESEPKSKGGRNPIKRVFDKISDSNVVKLFKKTKKAVISKCQRLYEGITQYCVCFLKGISQAFNLNQDLYGRISHYHRILSFEIDGLPTRKTLSNWFKWYEEYEPEYNYEDHSAKAKRYQYNLWHELIAWIRKFLIKIAPQYAFA